MREMLFKGKRTDNNKWIEGGYCYCNNKSYIVITTRYIPDTRDWDEADYYEKYPVYKPMFIEIIPETLGQYTGLTDKNGRKIFEGDIINIEYDETVVENAVIEYVGASFYGSTDYDSWELDGYCELEVIGNIHDNPELLNN